MSTLTIQLPDSLKKSIEALAAKEGWGDPAMDIYNDFAKEA